MLFMLFMLLPRARACLTTCIVWYLCLFTCLLAGSPIRQWMYYDAAEALPEKPLSKEEVQPIGCRYDGSIMVFGRTMQVGTGQNRTYNILNINTLLLLLLLWL